ncbi:hypothetical protein Ssi03_50400 [Sphaerisporangium siamense]|nr:hypothetical protein Ssi03_50400 [Sphaerisporangium siamense]
MRTPEVSIRGVHVKAVPVLVGGLEPVSKHISTATSKEPAGGENSAVSTVLVSDTATFGEDAKPIIGYLPAGIVASHSTRPPSSRTRSGAAA